MLIQLFVPVLFIYCCSYLTVLGRSPKSPPGSWFTRRIQRTQHIIVLTATIYYRLAVSKGKRHLRWSPAETRLKLPRVLSQESHGMYLITPAMSYDHTCQMLPTTEGLKRWNPGFLLGAGLVGSLCPAPTKILNPQKKSRLQHKPYCLRSFGRMGHS